MLETHNVTVVLKSIYSTRVVTLKQKKINTQTHTPILIYMSLYVMHLQNFGLKTLLRQDFFFLS